MTGSGPGPLRRVARCGLWLLAAALLMEVGLRLAFSVEPIFQRARGRDDASFRID